MKILLIAYYYPPINSGGTARPFKMAKYLPDFGHEVTVLTHSYKADDFDTPGTIRIKDISHNKDRGTFWKRVQWTGLRLGTEALNIAGIYHSIYSWWKRRVFRNARRIMELVKPDIIIATYPPVETLEIGLYFSRTFNIPLLTDFRDGLLFEPIESKRMDRYPCIRRKYAAIEKDAGSESVAITSIAEPITRYYRETYEPEQCLSIYSGYDPDDFENLPELQLDGDAFNIVFTGRFGLSDKAIRVDYFIEAVRRVLSEDETLKKRLKIHLVGEYKSEEFASIQDLIDSRVFVMHGFVDKPRALAFQRAADLLLTITQPERSSATSTKIFEYLYAGKPVFALTHETVLGDIVETTGSGWVVHPHRSEEIAALLKRIVTDQAFYRSLEPDREKIEGYSVKSQLKELHRLLETIKNGNNNEA